jgi:hypothetical protein
MKLTPHLHLVPRSRMHGAIPPLPNTPSWRGAQLKHMDNFTILCKTRYLYRIFKCITLWYLVPVVCAQNCRSVVPTSFRSLLKGRKVKLSLCLTKHHAMKIYRGCGGIAPCILDFGTRWRWVVRFMPWLFYPQGKSSWYPFDRRLGGPQSHSAHGGDEKNSQPPLRIKP